MAAAPVRVKLVPGQPVIIRNCLNSRLNGERVICEKYNVDLNEWNVKGDKFPLSIGMSIGEQFLEVVSEVSFTDTDGDVVKMKREGSHVAQYLNGELLIENLTFLKVDKKARTYLNDSIHGTFGQDEDLDSIIALRDALFWPDVVEESRLSDSLQPAPTLLGSGTCSVKPVRNKNLDLLRTTLEDKCEAMFECSKEDVSEIVSAVHEHATGIIQQGSGLGASGECPFASADEVDLYHNFCLKVLAKWSEHKLGRDERIDSNFFSQINDLCEILSFLDTDAVPLPAVIDKKIKLVQQEGLFPNWVRGQKPKGEAALSLCLAIGKKWQLQETAAFQEALASSESCN